MNERSPVPSLVTAAGIATALASTVAVFTACSYDTCMSAPGGVLGVCGLASGRAALDARLTLTVKNAGGEQVQRVASAVSDRDDLIEVLAVGETVELHARGPGKAKVSSPPQPAAPTRSMSK